MLFAQLSMIAFLGAHIIIPYSIHASSIVSEKLTQKIKDRGNNNIINLKHSLRIPLEKGGIKVKAERLVHEFDRAILDIPKKAEVGVRHVVERCSIFVVESVVIPVVAFFILFIFIKDLVFIYFLKLI